ncbi:MAG: ABC transporter ATP-binding protein [Spirochaetales bacterium]|nr:ABC transporter ATP-binding protein [Spirochaetales bacterium]
MEQTLTDADQAETITAVSIKNYSYSYPRREGRVLDGINLDIQRGELVALMGRNGAGKSTLCRSLIGVIPHSVGGTVWGEILINGLNTFSTSVASLAEHLGIVLDDPEAQLFTPMVDDEIAFGIENLCYPVEEIRESVEWAKEVVRLEGCGDREPSTLSGGQKQRLAIASALAPRPSILVLDEPTSQLDPVGTFEVFDVIYKLKTEHNMTIVISTHKSELIAEYADRIVVLHEGKVIGNGHPRAIFRNREIMKKASIHPPQVSMVADRLAEKGGVSFTEEDYPITRAELCDFLRKRGIRL